MFVDSIQDLRIDDRLKKNGGFNTLRVPLNILECSTKYT